MHTSATTSKIIAVSFCIAAASILLSGCLHILDPKVIKDARITEQNTHASCARFILDSDAAEDFFINANPTTSISGLHDSTATRNCYAAGSGTKKGKQCNWEIRSEGTGVIQCGQSSYEYVCHKCF